VLDSLVCSPQELTTLISLFDLHQSGHVYYLEFLNKLRNSDYQVGGRPLKPKPSLAWSEKTYRELSRRTTDQRINAELLFTNIDTRKENKLSLADFTRGLREIGDFLSPEEMSLLADEFDIRGDGQINYRQFLNKLEDYRNKKQTADRVTSGLVKHCTDKGIDFEEELKRVDPRGSKKVPMTELSGLLQRIGFAVSALDIHSFVEELPVDDSSNYLLAEICKKVPKPRLHVDPQKIAGQIRSYMSEKRLTVDQLLAIFDRDRNGSLNSQELGLALQRIGVVGLSPADTELLMKEWDKKQDGRLDLVEISSVLGVSLTLSGATEPHSRDLTRTSNAPGPQPYGGVSQLGPPQPYAGTSQSASQFQPSYSQPIKQEQPPYNASQDPRAPQGLLHPDQLRTINAALNATPYPRICADLYSAVITCRVSLDSAFSKLDTQRKGYLPTKAFTQVLYDDLRALDSRACTPLELTTLIGLFDLHQSGHVYYLEFLNKLRNTDYQIGGRPLKPKPSLAWSEKTYRELTQKIEMKRLNLDIIFSRLDPRRENTLVLADFARGVAEIAELASEEVGLLADEFDVRGDGRINYRQFIVKLEEYRRKQPTSSPLTQSLAKYCADRSIDFEAEVRRVDLRNTKRVSKAELTGIFQRIGFQVSATELSSLIEGLPCDTQGYFTLTELCEKLGKSNLRFDPEQIAGQMRGYMRENSMTFEQMFVTFDRDRNRVFSASEFGDALQRMKITGLSPVDITQLMTVWDTKKDGRLDFDELAISLGIKSTSTLLPPEQAGYRTAAPPHTVGPQGGHPRQDTSPYNVYQDPRAPQGLPHPDQLRSINAALNATPYPRIFTDLYSALITSKVSLDAFSKLDSQRKGLLPVKTFSQVLYDDLRVLELRACTPLELITLIGLFDLHQSGHIYYLEFLSKLRNSDYQIGGRPLKPKPSLAWSEKTYRELSRRTTDQKINAELLFTKIDTRRENWLSLADFTRGLREIGDFLSTEELNLLADEFDIRGDGQINYRQFLNKLEDYRTKQHVADSVTEGLAKHCQDKNLDLEEELRIVDPRDLKKLSRTDFTVFLQRIGFVIPAKDLPMFLEGLPIDDQGNYLISGLCRRIPKPKHLNTQQIGQQIKAYMTDRQMSIEQLFTSFDRDRNGSFSTLEFAQVLQRVGVVGLSADDISHIVRQWDTKRDSQLDMEELSSALGVNTAAASTGALSGCFAKLRAVITSRNITLQQFFKQHDADFSNTLSRKELDSALASIQIYLSPQELDRVMLQLDASQDGQISFLELLNMFEADTKATVDFLTATEAKVRGVCKGRRLADILRVSRDGTSEFVTYAEFKSGLCSIDPSFTDAEFNTVFAQLDPSKTGRLLVPRVSAYFEPQQTDLQGRAVARLESSKPHWAEQWLAQIRDYCLRSSAPVAELLGRYCSHPGVFSVKEFNDALNVLTLDIDQPAIDRLVNELKIGLTIPASSLLDLLSNKPLPAKPTSSEQADRNSQLYRNEPQARSQRTTGDNRDSYGSRLKDDSFMGRDSQVETYVPQRSRVSRLDLQPSSRPGFEHVGKDVVASYAMTPPPTVHRIDSSEDRGRFPAEIHFQMQSKVDPTTGRNPLEPLPSAATYDQPDYTVSVNDRGRFPGQTYFEMQGNGASADANPGALGPTRTVQRGRDDPNTAPQLPSSAAQVMRDPYEKPRVDAYAPSAGRGLVDEPSRLNDPRDPSTQGKPALQDKPDSYIRNTTDLQARGDPYAQPKADPYAQARPPADAHARPPADAQARPLADAHARAPADSYSQAKTRAEPYAQARGQVDDRSQANLRISNTNRHWALPHIIKMKEELRARRMTVAEAFHSFDINQDKSISPYEFGQGLKAYNVQMTNEEHLRLFDELDVNRNGVVTLDEFEALLVKIGVDLVGADYRPSGREQASDLRTDARPAVRREAEAEIARPEVSQADLVWAEPLFSRTKQRLAEMRTTMPAFFAYPRDAIGCVSYADFSDGLYRLGMNSSSPEVQRLVQLFEVQGRISVPEFEASVNRFGREAQARKPQSLQPARRLAQKDKEYLYTCFDYIADCIKENRETVHAFVTRYDTNRNEKIEFQEYQRMVAGELQIPSEKDVFSDMFLLLDGGEGNIPIRRLIDALTGVRIDQVATLVAPGRSDDLAALRSVVSSLQSRRVSLLNIYGKERGTIPTATFLQGLRNNGVNLSPQSELALVNLLAVDADKSQVSLDRLSQMMPQTDTLGRTGASQSSLGRTGATPGQTFNVEPTRTVTYAPNTTSSIDPVRTAAHPPPASTYQDQRAARYSSPPTELDSLLSQLNAELVRQNLSAADAFQRFDANGDGQMTRNEFLQASIDLRVMMPQESLLRLFDILDTNRSGSLSINEFSLKVTGAANTEAQRAASLKISSSTHSEIEELFGFFDRDKDGFIDEKELEQAFRAYNQTPSPHELRDILRTMDTNRNGKIELGEFKQAMEVKIKDDIMKSEDSLQDLRQKFVRADYNRLGYLSPLQVKAVLVDMNIHLEEAEFNALIATADSNQDAQIDIDEFMILMTSNGSIQDPVAASAAFNIRRARRLSPMDFLKMFSSVPAHFIPSFIADNYPMGRVLPAQGIIPSLDSSGVRFKDVCSVVSPNKASHLTFLKQNPVRAGGYVCLKLATGVSIPDSTAVDRSLIVARLCRVALFDTVKQDFISNSCQIEARWRSDLEDRWNFEVAGNDATSDIVFRVGPSADLERVKLIFEFVVVIKRDRPVEMSCGFASLALNGLDRLRAFKIPIEGGSPVSPQQIKSHDVRTYRTGWRGVIASAGLSSVRQELQAIFVDWSKLPFMEIAQLESMPDICVVNKLGMQMCQVARDYSAKLLASSGLAVPKMCDTIYTQFPSIVNCWDVWSSLYQYWNSPEFYRVAGADRTEEANITQLKALISRLYVVMHSNEFELDDAATYRTSFGMAASNREDLKVRRAALVARALRNTADSRLDELSYKPFDISELTPAATLNLDSAITRSLRGHVRAPDPQRMEAARQTVTSRLIK
jgi:Ca2+-binding EF-hand superfamily protein